MANTSDVLGGQASSAILRALWLCLAAHPCRAQPSLQAATRGGVRLTPSDLPPDRVELRWRQRLDSLLRALRQLQAYEGIDAPLPRQVIREAFAANLVRNGQIWIDMLEQRNLMAHTYDIQRAQRALTMIQGSFAPALLELARDLEDRP